MASPAVAATNTSITDSNATSHTVSLPASISSGDLLIVAFGANGFGPGVSWPAGWTEFLEFDHASTGTLALAYRQADGGEGATITVTTVENERSAHLSWRITGHEDPATQAPEASTGAEGTSTAPNPDSISPTGGSKDYLFLAIHEADQDTDPRTNTTASPSGYGNLIEIDMESTQGVIIAGGDKAATAASEDPGTFTISNSAAWVAATVAIHPAAAGGIIQQVMHHRKMMGVS